MNDELKMEVVDEVNIPEGQQGILVCSPGRAFADTQVNGKCFECGTGLFHDADAPTLRTVCAPCAIKMIRDEQMEGESVDLKVTRTAANRASAACGVSVKELTKGAVRGITALVEEED